jgi:preprotein translocase subunit SecG
MMLPLAAVAPIMKVIGVLWAFIALVLILLILIQKGKGGGLGGAFGGAGASSLLGAKTGDFLTWVTIALAVLFLFLGIIMAKFYRPQLSKEIEIAQPPAVTQPQATEQPAPDTEQPTTESTQE